MAQTGAGRILLTELNNDYNPLIRYDVGDIGSICPNAALAGTTFPCWQNCTDGKALLS
jgi:phenylacetate-coenzyme A ligase PaaK-like adenylate-forming protein